MPEQINIREYTPTDKSFVIELLQLNTPAYFSPDEEHDLHTYLDTEIELYFVIEVNQKIVGCGGINFTDDQKTGKISWDILHPDFQGKSLGSKLLHYRIERLKQIESLEQIIVRTSQLAYRFYEKQGFKLLEIIEDYWAKDFHLYSMKYVDFQ